MSLLERILSRVLTPRETAPGEGPTPPASPGDPGRGPGGSERGTPSWYWPTDKALELLHGTNRCGRCGGRGWIATEDPLYPEALIDARCPVCARRAKAR